MNKRTAYIAAIFLALAFGLSPLLAGSACGDPGCGMPCGMSVKESGAKNSNDHSRFEKACCCDHPASSCGMVNTPGTLYTLPPMHYKSVFAQDTHYSPFLAPDPYPPIRRIRLYVDDRFRAGPPAPVPLYLKNLSLIL